MAEQLTDSELLTEVKTRLSIADTYHDTLLAALIEDVKAYMLSGGVAGDVVSDNISVGCIARGVADLWNMGAGDGKFSDIFRERVIQLSMESVPNGTGA